MARTSLIALLCAVGAGFAEPAQNLADASLEELLNIEVVSAGSKAQSLKTTAASVYVITAADIRRSGMHSLPDLLRLAPGVQVARTASGTWAVSIRGFNGDYANKLLVLVDGRVIYNDIWAGVFWDMEEVALDNIERIEVIRGPAAALWGANAVNGVINILSKPAEATQKGLLSVQAGTHDVNTSVRYGGAMGPKAFYRVTARHGSHDALPADAGGLYGGPALTSSHGWDSDSADFRVDWNPTTRDALFFSGRAYHSTLGEPTTFITPASLFAPRQDTSEDSFAGGLMGQWQHGFSNGSSLEGRVSWDHQDHGYAALPISYNVLESNLQYHLNAGTRNDLVWGVNSRQAQYRTTPTLGHQLRPADADLDFHSTYFEDQIALQPDRFYFIAGVNLGHNVYTGVEVQPAGRFLWTPNRKLTSWAGISHAVRTPSFSERALDYNVRTIPAQPPLFGLIHATGDPAARAESVLAYEAGQRIEAGHGVSFDVSGFWNRYQHLLYFETQPPDFIPPRGSGGAYLEIPLRYRNAFHGHSHGLEFSANWRVTPRWKLSGGYSWLDVQTEPDPGRGHSGQTINQSPAHQFNLRSAWDVTRRLQVDTALCYTGIIPEAVVPSHLRGDMHLGWKVGEYLEISGGVQDTFQPAHRELPAQYQIQQLLVQRNLFGAVTWRF